MRTGFGVPLRRGNYWFHFVFGNGYDLVLQVHHILAEIIQGGLVLETNVEEIDHSGKFCVLTELDPSLVLIESPNPVQTAAKARKESFASANPLSLGVGGGMGARSAGLQTPLGWLTGKFTGAGTR